MVDAVIWVLPIQSSSPLSLSSVGRISHAVNEYIRKGEVDPAIKEQIDRKHKVSRFKFQTLPVYQNGLPIVLPEETDYYNPNKK